MFTGACSSKTDADGAASQRYVDIEIGREGEGANK
jgi:hypothetical protein